MHVTLPDFETLQPSIKAADFLEELLASTTPPQKLTRDKEMATTVKIFFMMSDLLDET